MENKFNVCKQAVHGNDGRLLQMKLPAHVAEAYPVSPRYATFRVKQTEGQEKTKGGFHLHKNAIEYFENILKTYANGEQCSVMMLRGLANRYLETAGTYLS